VADSKYPQAKGRDHMLIALVLLFGAGYIWRSVPVTTTGSALIINRAMALFYLFLGELALIAYLT
jgi:hypothetical protein